MARIASTLAFGFNTRSDMAKDATEATIERSMVPCWDDAGSSYKERPIGLFVAQDFQPTKNGRKKLRHKLVLKISNNRDILEQNLKTMPNN